MSRYHAIPCVLSLCLLSIEGVAQTSVLHLKDGSTIQGKILTQDDSVFVIETSYGTLGISRSSILRQETPQRAPEPQTFQLNDGTTIVGTVVFENADSLRVETAFGMVAIPKSSLRGRRSTLLPSQKGIEGPASQRVIPVSSGIGGDKVASSTSPGGRKTWLGGAGSLSVTSSGSSKVTSISVTPNVVFFLGATVGLGFDMSLSWTSAENSSATSFALGPKMVIAFGSAQSRTYPYVGVGVDYLTSRYSHESSNHGSSVDYTLSSTGNLAKAAFGVMNGIGESLGMPMEIGVLFTNIEGREQVTTFAIGIGLTGLL